MRIVFMGTPAFAVPSLDVLINSGHEVVGVITSTDKMGGRGNKVLLESEVKKYALLKNLNILQPKNLKSPVFIEELRALNADVQVVVAFRMLPEVVWNMPQHGTINLHGSLLPKYRGAAPLNWAIINGDKRTGVTAFKLKHEIDTGDVILKESLAIEEEDNVGTVHDRMMHLGASVVARAIQKIEAGNVEMLKQDDSLVSKAPKIFKEDCKIDFNQESSKIRDFVRGMSPYPTAWMTLEDGNELKLYDSRVKIEAHQHTPGEVIFSSKEMKIATMDGFLFPQIVQLSGKRKMDVQSFLNGYNFNKI